MFHRQRAGQPSGLTKRQIAVCQGQGLLGEYALLAPVTLRHAGGIKNLEELHLLLRGVLEVEAPPRDGKAALMVDGRAAHGRFQTSGHGEQAVTNNLGLGAPRGPPPQKEVVRVAGEVCWLGLGILAVGGTGDDQAVDRLHTPAL